MSGFYYLATPYRAHPGGLDLAYDDAVRLTARMTDAGIEVFSPIVHSHHVARFVTKADAHSDFWLARQLPMMRAAVGIIVAKLPGWDRSSGIRFERDHFRTARKPERFVDPTLTCIVLLMGDRR